MAPDELRQAFMAAKDKLFELEEALGPLGNDDRRQIYALRCEVGVIGAAVLREKTPKTQKTEEAKEAPMALLPRIGDAFAVIEATRKWVGRLRLNAPTLLVLQTEAGDMYDRIVIPGHGLKGHLWGVPVYLDDTLADGQIEAEPEEAP